MQMDDFRRIPAPTGLTPKRHIIRPLNELRFWHPTVWNITAIIMSYALSANSVHVPRPHVWLPDYLAVTPPLGRCWDMCNSAQPVQARTLTLAYQHCTTLITPRVGSASLLQQFKYLWSITEERTGSDAIAPSKPPCPWVACRIDQ